MALIDQRVTWRAVEERLATETDPVLRRNLELLLQHMHAEATLDMDRLMATQDRSRGRRSVRRRVSAPPAAAPGCPGRPPVGTVGQDVVGRRRRLITRKARPRPASAVA